MVLLSSSMFDKMQKLKRTVLKLLTNWRKKLGKGNISLFFLVQLRHLQGAIPSIFML